MILKWLIWNLTKRIESNFTKQHQMNFVTFILIKIE